MFDNADKFLKIAAGLSLFAAGVGIGYHYGIYLPAIEQKRMAVAETVRTNAALKEAKLKSDYTACLIYYENEYQEKWEGVCKRAKKEESCSLPVSVSDRLYNKMEAGKKTCLEEFKAGT
jgi:hypothetical protein